ncbi:hypothetical protein IL306_003305 [Fusarium sp. DS 682]|nr:hypothetical protein IL306_003305 [Fusarium sp. DS 682]
MVQINDLLGSASSEAELTEALDLLHKQEDALMSKLGSPVENCNDLNRDLGCLDYFHGDLGMQLIAAQSIHNAMLSTAGNTAERLSTMIRALDTEKTMVEATLLVIEQVTELKACIAGLVGSMGAPQDWEAAAGYLSRASTIPEDVIRGDFALAFVPSIEAPEAPWTTIQSARESLCTLFLREFNAAVEQRDGTKIARFFKLFPIIGEDIVGLDAYGWYVCQGMAEAAGSALKGPRQDHGKQPDFFYANNLVKLFEHIVQIIDSHSGLVERHYGSSKVVKVIERLQVEADVQGGIILDMWDDERAVNRIMADIKSYPFSILLKSMMPVEKGIGFALRSTEPNKDEPDLDVKKVEGLFADMTTILRSWSLYERFIASKCKGSSNQDTLSLPRFLHQCNLQKKISEKLIEPYKITATFLFRRSVEKAFEMDTAPSGLSLTKPCQGGPPFILQAVHDIIYVLDNILQRVLFTGNREVVISITLAINRVLESDFIGIIHRRMEESYPKPLVLGGFPAEDKIISFMVLINSLDMAKEYLGHVIRSRGSVSEPQSADMAGVPSETLDDSFPFEMDTERVTNALHSLSHGLSAKATELLNDGIQVLLDEVLWPRVRLILSNSFQVAVYDVEDEESLDEEDENGETVSRRFEAAWLALTRPLKHIMTPKTYAALVSLAANKLAMVLEKRVWGYSSRVTAFGGLRLEWDFSGIISTVTQGDYTLREPFARLQEILATANIEDEEWDELISGHDSSEPKTNWLLSDEDKAKARKIVRR